MSRKASLSGFHEWLPAERLVEQHVLDTLRRTFELHGFAGIETRAVETLGQLLRKGEVDKEVYAVPRLAEDEEVAAGRRESPCTIADALEAYRTAEACELSRAERRPVAMTEIRGL